MKKNLIILLSVIFIGFVAAVTVGQVITQQQLDNLNVSEQDLEEHFLRDQFNGVEYDCYINSGVNLCDFFVNIKTIVPNENNVNVTNYTVIEKNVTIKTRIQTWIDIKNEHNKTYAVSQLKEWLKSERDKIEADTKREISEYQTPEELDMADIIADLDFID